MAARKRTVEVEVVVDDAKARRDLDKIAGATTKTGKSFSSMATLVKTGMAAFSAREVFQALQNMDRLNTQMEANEQRAETVFGSMIEDVKAWTDAQNEAFGLSENGLLGLASNMQDLLVPMGFVREEATDLTKETLLVANALDDWKGGTLGVENATERIIKAMLGEREGLVELGIKISEADVKSRLLAKGQDELTGAALEQAKAQATLEIIMEKSTDALTAYENRAGSAVATQKELAAQTADTAESWSRFMDPHFESAKELIGDTTLITAKLTGALDDQRESVIAEGSAIDRLADVLRRVSNPFILLGDIAGIVADQIRGVDDAVEGLNSTLGDLTAAEKRARDAFSRIVSGHTGAERTARRSGGTSGGGGGIFRHSGGVVPGTPGEDVPIVAQAGEEVVRRSEVSMSEDARSHFEEGRARADESFVFHRGGTTIVNNNTFSSVTPTQIREALELARRGRSI